MSQATVSRSAYRLKIALPWLVYLISLAFIASVITFLVFTGKASNSMHKSTDNSNNESGIYNGSDSFYRELSYQASVISLLTIITICVVYYTFKNIL